MKPVSSGHSIIDKINVLKPCGSLMQVKSTAECSTGSILQYFWPALSDYRSWKPIFWPSLEWPLKTGFTIYNMSWCPAKDAMVGSHVVFVWIHCTDVRIHCIDILIECYVNFSLFSHLCPESYTLFSSPHFSWSNATRKSLIKLLTLVQTLTHKK